MGFIVWIDKDRYHFDSDGRGRQKGLHDLGLRSRGLPGKKSLLIILQTFCTLILLSLGTTAFVQGDLALALGDGIVAAVFVATTVYLLKTSKIKPVAWIGLVALGALFTYLLFEGGVNYTGYVWLPTYPMLTIFLLGPLRGGILAGIVIGVFLVGRLFFPQLLGADHPYSFDFMLRFCVSISVIIFVTVYMEMAWKEAQSSIPAVVGPPPERKQQQDPRLRRSQAAIWEDESDWFGPALSCFRSTCSSCSVSQAGDRRSLARPRDRGRRPRGRFGGSGWS